MTDEITLGPFTFEYDRRASEVDIRIPGESSALGTISNVDFQQWRELDRAAEAAHRYEQMSR